MSSDDIIKIGEWFFKAPVYWIVILLLLIFIFYILSHGEKVQIWQSIFQSWSSSKESKKKSVTNRVSGEYKSAKKQMPEEEKDLFPTDVVIKWQDGENEDRESFIEGNQVIIRIGRTDNYSKAMSFAALEVVKVGVLASCKRFVDKDICLASDHILARKLLRYMNKGYALAYFDNSIFQPLYRQNAVFKEYFDKLDQADRKGMYVAVFLNEVRKVADQLSTQPISKRAEDEIASFLSFLHDVCTKKPAPKLRFFGEYIRINIAFTGTNERLGRNNPYTFYVEKAFNAFEQGVETVYMFAVGRKIDDAKGIEDEFNKKHPNFAATRQISYVHSFQNEGNKRREGICIEFQIKEKTLLTQNA